MINEEIEREYQYTIDLIQKSTDVLRGAIQSRGSNDGFSVKWAGVSLRRFITMCAFQFGEATVMRLDAGIKVGEQVKVGDVVVNPVQGLPDNAFMIGFNNDSCFYIDMQSETRIIPKYVDPSLQ